jgi:IS5 family transposase
MIEMRRMQPSFGDGLIAAEVSDLREPWMGHADAVLGGAARLPPALSRQPHPARHHGAREPAALALCLRSEERARKQSAHGNAGPSRVSSIRETAP